jgi:hypothetical protein
MELAHPGSVMMTFTYEQTWFVVTVILIVAGGLFALSKL